MKKKLYIFLIIVLGVLIAAAALYLYHHTSSFREGLDAGPMVQYVKVSYPSSAPNYIQISQIAVYSGGKNIAPTGTTTASTPYSAESAKENVIDGTLSARAYPSIYHSQTNEANQFWQLDLGKEYPVDKVVYYNRKDCCSDRANGMTIELADKYKEEVEKLTLTDQMEQTFDLEPVKSSSKQEKTCPRGQYLNDMNDCIKVDEEDDDKKRSSYDADYFKRMGGYIPPGEEGGYSDYGFAALGGYGPYGASFGYDGGAGGGYNGYDGPYREDMYGPGGERHRRHQRHDDGDYDDEYDRGEKDEYDDGTSSYVGPAGDTVIIGRKREHRRRRDKKNSHHMPRHHSPDRNHHRGKCKNSKTTPATKIPNADSPYCTDPVLPPGQEDKYMLKSQIVPPVSALYPGTSSTSATASTTNCLKQAPFPPCPPCERCPEPAFDCKKVPNYSSQSANSNLPRPVLADFSSFGM